MANAIPSEDLLKPTWRNVTLTERAERVRILDDACRVLRMSRNRALRDMLDEFLPRFTRAADAKRKRIGASMH